MLNTDPLESLLKNDSVSMQNVSPGTHLSLLDQVGWSNNVLVGLKGLKIGKNTNIGNKKRKKINYFIGLLVYVCCGQSRSAFGRVSVGWQQLPSPRSGLDFPVT